MTPHSPPVKPAPKSGPWLSTAHSDSHKPDGGDEITPTDIGAVTVEQLADLTSPAMMALEKRVAVLESAFGAHKTQKAGVAHR
jgi:hypothetical protein